MAYEFELHFANFDSGVWFFFSYILNWILKWYLVHLHVQEYSWEQFATNAQIILICINYLLCEIFLRN